MLLERTKLDYIDIIEKSIYNIDSKICGIIDDYTVLQDSQKVADYVIQFLRTYLEHIAARIYAYENPNKQVPIGGKDKWYTQYMKPLKESNEYGYIWRLHHSLQITISHYVPAEDGAVRLMEGYLSRLYQLRDQMREKFELTLMRNLEEYPQEKNSELDPYYEKIYIALKGMHLEDGTKHTNDRYYITRKKYRTVNRKGFFEYTLSYAQEEITKFDRFVAYSFNDIPDNYSIQCDFDQANVDFNGVDIDIKCIIAWNISIRPCELEKLAAICGYDDRVRSDSAYYKALMRFLSRSGMNLLDIILADNEDYEIYIQQLELDKNIKLKNTFEKVRDIIIGEKPGSNILRYITAYLKNDVVRDQLSDRSNNRVSYLYLKNEAIPFDEMPYASSLYGHNLPKSRLHKCLEVYDCEHQYVSAMVNKEAYDSNTLYVTVDDSKLDYFRYELEVFNQNLYKSKKQQLRKIETFTNHLYVKGYYDVTKSVMEKLQQYTSEGVEGYSDMLIDKNEFINKIDDVAKQKIVKNIFMKNLFTKIGAMFVMGGLNEFKQSMDYREYGGAPLLGTKRPVIKGHGSSDGKAVFSAIRQAKKFVETNLIEEIVNNINCMEEKSND